MARTLLMAAMRGPAGPLTGYWQASFFSRLLVSLRLAWIIERFGALPTLARPAFWRLRFLRSFLHLGSSAGRVAPVSSELGARGPFRAHAREQGRGGA